MTDQLTLELQPLVVPASDPNLTIDERFALFHAANPHVAASLITLVEDARNHGQTRVGIKALYEVLRWHGTRTTGDKYALNNDYTALYARLIADERPDLAGMFNLRNRRETQRAARRYFRDTMAELRAGA